MTYKFDVQLSGNYSAGRPAGAPSFIVIHHWGVDGQSHQGVADYLCRKGGMSSAHYVASEGRVTMLVDPSNRAWHAGSQGNPRGIGIECRPEMSAGDFETVAELVAYLRGKYGNLPLRGHKNYMNTACPGRWYGKLGKLSARADAIRKAGGTSQASQKAPSGFSKLDVDGALGPLSVSALQRVLGTPVDGVVSGQYKSNAKYVPALNAVRYGRTGSTCVRALQAKVGAVEDGHWGPATSKALQKKLGVDVDGYFGPKSAKALQRALNAGKLY